MNNLNIILDTLYNGYYSDALVFLFLISLVFAILVITTKNPVISVLFLIGVFFSIACYLISIDMSFIGISYLLVYVGAVSILFLFILMLINIRVSELTTETKNSLPLIFLVALVFENAYAIGFNKNSLLYNNLINTKKTNITSYIDWENSIIQFNHITNIGYTMYTNYSILLIIISVILLLAMLGAIIITIKQPSINLEYINYNVLELKKF